MRPCEKIEHIVAKEKQQGKQKEAEGIALGQALAKDEMLAQLQSAGKRIVFERFSSLTRITREVLAAITDPGLLLLIVIKLAQIQSAEEAQEFLLCLHPQFVNRTQQESRALS